MDAEAKAMRQCGQTEGKPEGTGGRTEAEAAEESSGCLSRKSRQHSRIRQHQYYVETVVDGDALLPTYFGTGDADEVMDSTEEGPPSPFPLAVSLLLLSVDPFPLAPLLLPPGPLPTPTPSPLVVPQSDPPDEPRVALLSLRLILKAFPLRLLLLLPPFLRAEV